MRGEEAVSIIMTLPEEHELRFGNLIPAMGQDAYASGHNLFIDTNY